MHIIDITIFVVYAALMLGVGFYFSRKNKSTEDYYVGGRSIGPWHIGLSVVATDVGGGFSIGLGGLGFTMGLSGSWMLFTGLIGAWLSAVVLIPTISKMSSKYNLLTFPQVFEKFYSPNVALLAGIISVIGYLGFTSSQILAGAKLASASIPEFSTNQALLLMGAVAVIYTVIGGIKAVIYTDTIQWIILMTGLIFIGLPLAYNAVGGINAIRNTLQPEMLSFNNLTWQDLVKWFVTIVPIWFVGMTLYQRIYASKSAKHAQKAWFIAGLFEWPIMALMGVALGLLSRVALDQGLFLAMGIADSGSFDQEKGIPVLLATILPVGLLGLMLSAYFSAILSTADSCLMAASGNLMTDIIERFTNLKSKIHLRLSQFITLTLGALALLIAWHMTNVLDLMLYSYSFMVSGLFVPVLGALFWKKSSTVGAFWAMLLGGALTAFMVWFKTSGYLTIYFGKNAIYPFGLDPNVFGISLATLVFILFSYWFPNKNKLEKFHKNNNQ